MAYALQIHKNEKYDYTVLSWLTKLNKYNFTITHLLDRDNVLSDLLLWVQDILIETIKASIWSVNQQTYFLLIW